MLFLCFRNNLYWSRIANAPCLWYGADACDDDQVKVLRLRLSADDHNDEEEVSREDLTILDASLLNTVCNDRTICSIATALLDFAEWDEYKRPSYIWPTFLHLAFLEPRILAQLYTQACEHPLASFFRSNDRKFLFFICATHCGIQEEFEFDKQHTSGTNISESVAQVDVKIVVEDQLQEQEEIEEKCMEPSFYYRGTGESAGHQVGFIVCVAIRSIVTKLNYSPLAISETRKACRAIGLGIRHSF